jgi:hypothetical protein
MIIYARKTRKESTKDVLVLDWPDKKKSLVKVITDTKNIYDWTTVIDLSRSLEDSHDLNPTSRKKIIRKIKSNPLVRPVYNFLLSRHRKKHEKIEEQKITSGLAGLGEVAEVNILTQTGITDSLFKLFPKVAVNYFEHGLGDYFLIQKVKQPRFNFYCVFADRFKKHLTQKKLPAGYVKEFITPQEFIAIAEETIEKSDEKNEIFSRYKVEGKKVIILLESVEIYNVPDNFWTDFLDLCMSKIKNPQEYTFILKPHPAQSFKAIEISKNHMINHHKVKTLVIENSYSVNYSVEVLYSLWNDTAKYVFTVFSSGIYYISKIYANKQTNYFYAFDFFKGYTKQAPQQFLYIFNGLEDLVKNVFNENCTDISKK